MMEEKMLVPFLVVSLLVSMFSNAEDRIIQTHILYRHGDRSPIVTYKTNIYNESNWPQGYGQLSTIGMQQHFELGRFLRRKYMEGFPYKLLNSSYDRHEVEIRSTDVERTLMSAYANLAGFYPPHGDQIWNPTLPWQPIPVHTVPKLEDNLIHMDSVCPLYNKVYQEVLDSDEVANIKNDYKEFYNFVKNKTGKLNLDITNIWEINDVLLCESKHNFTLPDWASQSFYGQTVLELLGNMDNMQFDLQFNRLNEAKLKGGSLLFKILNDTKGFINDPKTTKKAYIYSAHDDTMSAFLSALTVFNKIAPPYAACTMVDVFETTLTDGSVDHFVTVSYRNESDHEPYVFQLPGCEVRCPLEIFEKLLEPNVLHDWHKECRVNNNTILPEYINYAVLASLALLVVILLVAICVVVMKKRRNEFNYNRI